MASNGPPMEEHLRDQDCFDYHNFCACRFFCPWNCYNRVVHLPPADHVEVEEEDAEPHRVDRGGVLRTLFLLLDAWRGEEDDGEEDAEEEDEEEDDAEDDAEEEDGEEEDDEDEEIDAVGLGDVAEPDGGGGDGQESWSQ